MRAVWFFFKLIEAMLGSICVIVHIVGFLNVDVKQDNNFYIIVFSTFTVSSMFGCLSICLSNPGSETFEFLLNVVASISYMITSLITMYHAEKDLYLIYLSGSPTSPTDIKEPIDKQVHPFFRWCKTQAITAVVASMMHLIHAVVTFDMLWHNYGPRESLLLQEDEMAPPKKAKLYVGGKTIHDFLLRYKWFRILDGEELYGDRD